MYFNELKTSLDTSFQVRMIEKLDIWKGRQKQKRFLSLCTNGDIQSKKKINK